MAYSYFDYEGTDTTIQTDILCVSTEHMYAFKVLSEEKSNVTLSDVALAATFTKNNAGVLCELDTAPSTKIRVIRSTPYDVLMHDFSNGAQFNAYSVDEVYEQLLYLCQEIVEGKLIIDSSGIKSAGCISQKELQAQIAAGKASVAQSAINAAAAANGASMADASRNADGSYSQLYLRDVRGRLEYGREDKILFYAIVKNNQGFNFMAIGTPYSAQSANTAQIREPTATKDIKEWASYAEPITSEKQYLEALKLVAGVGDIAKFNEK